MPTDEEKIDFSDKVETLGNELILGTWDALNEYCLLYDYEVEVAATLLTQSLIDRIADELNELNMFKTKTKKIPGL
jgi:hypothetical protein